VPGRQFAKREVNAKMLLSLSVSLIWLLAVIAAAIHARDCPRRLAGAFWALGAFIVTLALAMMLSPQPNWIGVLVGVGAFWRLIAGPLPRAGPLLGGASAALAAALAIAGGVSLWLAGPLTLAAFALALGLRGERSAARIRELEIVLVVTALCAPALGRHSATMLQRDAIAVVAPAPPAWTLAIVGFALVAGLLRGIWIRR
jgi:hypothetical protein